jgi:hypothetical protein
VAVTYKSARQQGSGTLATFTGNYNTTGSVTAIISSIAICNTGATNRLVRVGFAASATSPSAASGQFIAYDVTVEANDTIFIGEGVVMGNTEYLRWSSDSTDINFSASIAEIS